MTIRIGLMIDFDTDDPREAYRKVFRGMAVSQLEWQSTDAWYDTEGDEVLQVVVDAVTQEVISEEHGK